MITKENYRSLENEKAYMTYSQFSSMDRCSAEYMKEFNAKQNGTYKVEDFYSHFSIENFRMGRALEAYLVGGDYLLEQEFKGDEHLFWKKITKSAQEDYKKHEKAIKWSKGELEAKGQTLKMYERLIDEKGTKLIKPKREASKLYTNAVKYSKAILDHPDLEYIVRQATHSRILEGEIGGIAFKGELDLDFEGTIYDVKTTSGIHKKCWSKKKHKYVGFAENWSYHFQAAIYRELWNQNFEGEAPEYYLIAVEKADKPYARLINMRYKDDYEENLKYVASKARYYAEIKKGFVPDRCEECDYCKQSYRVSIDSPLNYKELI